MGLLAGLTFSSTRAQPNAYPGVFTDFSVTGTQIQGNYWSTDGFSSQSGGSANSFKVMNNQNPTKGTLNLNFGVLVDSSTFCMAKTDPIPLIQESRVIRSQQY